MDQISRRSFLKGAGMTVLAVAAVGMMTGCKGEDFVPDPQKVDVAVIFCKFGGAVENNLPSDKIQVDDYDPGDLKVHPSEDSVGIEDLALAVKVSGCKYYVTVNVAMNKGF